LSLVGWAEGLNHLLIRQKVALVILVNPGLKDEPIYLLTPSQHKVVIAEFGP
jgi:hypothetical protein